VKSVITKLLLIALALGCLSRIVFPAVWSDGKKVKDRSTQHYQNMFQ
jgi:hypothetical protein